MRERERESEKGREGKRKESKWVDRRGEEEPKRKRRGGWKWW